MSQATSNIEFPPEELARIASLRVMLDDEPGFPTAVQSNQTTKFSYQHNAANRVIGFWQRNWVDEPQAQAGRFVPYEATREVQWEPIQYKAEWQASPSSKLFYNVAYGRTSEEINYIPTTTDRPSTTERCACSPEISRSERRSPCAARESSSAER